MAKTFRYLLILLNLQQIFCVPLSDAKNLPKKFTSKCDDLCDVQNENETNKDLDKTDCLRGCQYFNIEFLLNARNKDKTVDLNQLVFRCGLSCSDAYNGDSGRKASCFRGCNDMMALQAKAPSVNGWLVYMGATDRNLVLLQPDSDIPSKEDWVLLDSMFRANDYEYDSQYYDKYFKADSNGQIKIVPPLQPRFTNSYCIPTWIWVLPLLILVAFLWIHSTNMVYNAVINERIRHLFAHDPNQFNAVPLNHDATTANESSLSAKNTRSRNEFGVGSVFFFYPTPAVPPPKYNEIAEAILGSSDEDDEGNGTTSHLVSGRQTQQKKPNVPTVDYILK